MAPRLCRIETILAHLSEDTDNVAVRSAAVCLAHRFGARLVGLYTIQPIGLPAPVVGRAASIAYIEEMAEAAKFRAPVNEAAFRESCAAAGVSCEWSIAEDDPARVLLEQMHYADLVLVAQAPPEVPGELSGNLLPDNLPIAGDGPVLVVPHGLRKTVFGQRVLIAWKPCREAGRALRDALPLLDGTDGISVLTVGNSEENHSSGDKIAARLERLGLKCERLRNYDGDSRAGSVILAQSKAWEADMIVMGAYGHSRLREFVLGGATRELLRHTPVPVLMSH